jgi:hypothetical protein
MTSLPSWIEGIHNSEIKSKHFKAEYLGQLFSQLLWRLLNDQREKNSIFTFASEGGVWAGQANIELECILNR